VTFVRAAGIADSAVLASLHVGSFERPWAEAEFRDLFGAPGVFGALAEAGDGPAAFGLAREAGGEAELLTLATAPGHRGRGLARRVLAELGHEAARRGVRWWFLEVSVANAPAIALYESMGFARAGRRPGYYPGPLDALILRRDGGDFGGQGGG